MQYGNDALMRWSWDLGAEADSFLAALRPVPVLLLLQLVAALEGLLHRHTQSDT